MPWSVLAVVSLAAVTGALAWAALGSSGTVPSPTPTGSAFVEPSATKSGKPADIKDARALDVEPALALVDATTAFRGQTGACLGGATLERTTDGGRTWDPIVLPTESLLDIEAQSQVVLSIVGSDKDCTPGAWSSSDAGAEWNGPTPTGPAWVRIDGNNKELRAPSGEVKNPCFEEGLVAVEVEGMSDTSAAVLCEEGVIARTDDAGATWPKAAPVVGAEALAWQDPLNGWVLASGGGACPAFQLNRTADGGATWSPGGCVGVAGDAGPQVARPSLAYANLLAGMAVIGEATWTTADGGNTWTQVRSRE